MAKFIVICLLILFSYQSNGADMKKFDWQASESAPRNIPMKIVTGSLESKDGYSQYIPNGSSIYYGWGNGWSTDVVGPDLKPLPEKLSITFYSYLEDQFYSGNFILPHKEILSLFENGYFSPKESKNITYDTIVVGVAPGGIVSVWLEGIDRRTEVYSGNSDKINYDWNLISKNPRVNKKDYIAMVIKQALKTDENIKSFNTKDINVGLWANYHSARYKWVPKFYGIYPRNNLINLIKYYNGEEGYLKYPIEDIEFNETRAIPKELHFVWSYSEHKNYSYELYFDEKEMFEVFENLGGNKEPLELEMRLYKEGDQNKFSVSLKNKNESKNLKKFRLETYGAN